jgi:hypothetical protein
MYTMGMMVHRPNHGVHVNKPLISQGFTQFEQERSTMKTVEEIIAYLEMELAEAHESHDLARDSQERILHLIKAATIESILEEIKKG